jgi:hypothetical protein
MIKATRVIARFGIGHGLRIAVINDRFRGGERTKKQLQQPRVTTKLSSPRFSSW